MSEYLDIHAVADGQVGPEEAQAFREQINREPHLQRELDAIVSLKSTIQQHCKGVPCEETWKSCQSRLASIEKADRVNGFVAKYSWQLCGSLVVCILMAGAWSRMGNQSRSIDPSQVPNIAGFSALPNSAGNEYGFQKYLRDTWRLNGAYRSQVNGRELVCYDLEDGIGRFALYAVAGVDQVEGACHRKVQGMNCYNWVHNGVQFMVMSDRDHTELEAIAAKVNSQR